MRDHLLSDLCDPLCEELAILRVNDRLDGRAQDPHTILFEYPLLQKRLYR
jgi:hypothetical protein